ncbi:MAG: hypothetical protein POG74_07260 [Acidocella sp.]|nr:hypothetical protein [Acidocella sp.]
MIFLAVQPGWLVLDGRVALIGGSAPFFDNATLARTVPMLQVLVKATWITIRNHLMAGKRSVVARFAAMAGLNDKANSL